jgi:predicted HTH domain antitoxin
VTLKFEIPDNMLEEMHISPAVAQTELTKEVVIALYARGLLSLGRACELSGMTRPVFESLIAQRRIERPYDVAELDRDLAWAKETKE